jgi:hypothetical protein
MAPLLMEFGPSLAAIYLIILHVHLHDERL